MRTAARLKNGTDILGYGLYTPNTPLQRLLKGLWACREARAWVGGKTFRRAWTDCSNFNWQRFLLSMFNQGDPTFSVHLILRNGTRASEATELHVGQVEALYDRRMPSVEFEELIAKVPYLADLHREDLAEAKKRRVAKARKAAKQATIIAKARVVVKSKLKLKLVPRKKRAA